jgi:hypothetical protein
VKALGEINMVSMALVAAIDTELLEPPDAGTESWSQQPPRQPDLLWILPIRRERSLVPAGRGNRVRRALAARLAGQAGALRELLG